MYTVTVTNRETGETIVSLPFDDSDKANRVLAHLKGDIWRVPVTVELT